MPIETRRYEHVELRGDDRERNEGGAEHRELELDHEIFEEPGIDELRILGAHHPHIRPRQNIIDLLGKEKTADKRDAERHQRLDEPRTQLDQVVHQRRLAAFDVLVGHGLTPPSSLLLPSGRGGWAAGGVTGGAASAALLPFPPPPAGEGMVGGDICATAWCSAAIGNASSPPLPSP